MPPIPLLQIDAFTDRPFAGNPAAVCLLDDAAGAPWMQQVAQEMNLSETAFVHRQADGYGLRWFTPVAEVRLCGHATLAAAHALWETGALPLGTAARFHTLSGLLTATARDGWIELDFPALATEPTEAPAGLLDALGALASFVGRSAYDVLVEVASAAEVRMLAPDFGALGRVAARGVIVTARSDEPRFDFVSRFFAPTVGVNEDPVTGSAHAALGPYWKGRTGKDAFLAYQASARGGIVRVRVAGDRVHLAGQAVTLFRGELRP
jgi:PhzF family phenazine biosynthesis protein